MKYRVKAEVVVDVDPEPEDDLQERAILSAWENLSDVMVDTKVNPVLTEEAQGDEFPTFDVEGLWGGGLRVKTWKFKTEFSRSDEAHVVLIRLPSENDGPLDFVLWFHHEGVERYTTAEFFDNADANDSDEDRACKSMDETIKATIAEWDTDLFL
jgi:hypothetical protein